MKNVIKVFLSDMKRLGSNVVAIVIIMGLCIIPALYAWFNILSNWDVYGEAATSQMHIAVYSADQGMSIESAKLNIGDKVVDGLKANTTIGWVFTEDEEAALEGVNSGDFYAALIIPRDFTQNMISFIGGTLDHPKIEYYENSKRNAIATKITSKAKNAVQKEVNTSFVSTLTEVASKVGETFTGSSTEGGSLTDTAMDKLHDMSSDLGTYVSILNTLCLVTDSASGLIDSSQGVIPGLGSVKTNGLDLINGMEQSTISVQNAVETMNGMVIMSLDKVDKELASLEETIQNVSDSEYVKKLQDAVEDLDQSIEWLDAIVDKLPDSSNKTDIKNAIDTLSKDLDQTMDDIDKTSKDVKTIAEQLEPQIKICRTSIQNVKRTYTNEMVPAMNQTLRNVQSALVSASSTLNNVNVDFSRVDRALEAYQATLNTGASNIAATRDYVTELKEGLDDVIEGLDALTSDEQYKEVVDMLHANPELIATFVSSPVTLETKAVYEIPSYGSQMAPFYTVLALWVGALILVALMHVKVEREDDLVHINSWEAYFGRYISFFLVTQIQALITVLGDLFFVQIQCAHPFLFWVGAASTSFMFSIFMYSLTVAFGNVGEAIAVVVMVIQVAGGGGTFPIEVLPKVYQAIYDFLPFTYAMNALRESVGGLYQFDFLYDLAILGVFVLISLFIGLIVEIPFRKMNAMIDKSKEKSKVLI